MMPLAKLRRKSKIQWPKIKVVGIVAILVGGLLLVIVAIKLVRAPTLSTVLPATSALSTDDQRLSEVVALLAGWGLVVKKSAIEENLVRLLIEKTEIIVPLGEDTTSKLETLSRLWTQYKVLGRTIKKIDLRYSYPLVSY